MPFIKDGVSPIATVSQTDTGAVISITDKDGTTTATITNGKDGKDGADGKSAYEYAQDGGYTGTGAEFATKLAADQSVFRVTLTPNGDGTATADKTLDELVAAREAGRCVQVVFDDMILQEQRSPNANFMYGFTLFDNGEVVSYFATPLDEETAWGVSEWFESTTTNCIPYYYDEFKCAITDLSGSYPQNKMSDTSNHTPSVKVFTSDTGVKTIMLLTDVTVTEAITIDKSCDIVLNGHKLTFSGSAAYLNIAEGIDCTIWGNVDGSAIVKEGITTTDTSTVKFMTIRGDNVKLIGGEYIFGGSVNGNALALGSSAACNNLEIDGCTITVENTSDTSVGVLYGFQNAASNTVIRNSTITVNGVVNTIGGIRNSGGLTLEKSTVKVALSADGVLNGAYAITNSNTLIAEDSYILADSKGTSMENDEPATGISNVSTGTARLKNMTISGTHSAVINSGKLYISGGTYTGYCHGGIYFGHGADGIGYVNDATLRDGNYEGAFTDYFDALTYKNWGAFYVGGGSDASCSNMTVYMDNCTIEGVTTAFCMRGSSGETNNTVNLSNCTIVDGANRPINFHNTTHTVNVGTGCNITTDMASEPTCLKFTGKLYRKMHGDKVLDGKDYVALAEKVDTREYIVTVTGNSTDGYTADKTYGDVLAAHQAGRAVYCQLPDGAVLALVSANETGVVFQGEVNREYQKVVITSDDTVTYTSGKYALVGEVAKTYTVLVFPGGDGYTTEDGIDDILAACESSATVVCDVELDGEQSCLRLPLVKYNATAAYFGAVFDGKEYLVTITADGVTVEIARLVNAADATPDYIVAEADRVSAVVQSHQNVNTLTVIVASDFHHSIYLDGYAEQSAESLKHCGQGMHLLQKKVQADMVARLGDYFWDNGQTPEQVMEETRQVFEETHTGLPELNVPGNHDGNGQGTAKLSTEQIFVNVGIRNAGAVYSGNRILGDCYRDFADQRLRLIALNTSAYSLSQAQRDWLVQVLDAMGTGWKAILFSHCPLNWDANNQQAVTLLGGYADKVLCIVHGHTHNYLVTELGNTGIKQIAIPNACFWRSNEYSGGWADETTYNKTAGTAEDTAFCVLTFDPMAGVVYADHYGAGIDRKVVMAPPSAYTNVLPMATTAYGGTEIYGGDYNNDGVNDGYKKDTRISSSATISAATGMCLTGFIPVTTGDVVRIKNITVTGAQTSYLITRDASGEVAAQEIKQLGEADANGVYTWTNTSGRSAIRLSVGVIDETTIITINEEII